MTVYVYMTMYICMTVYVYMTVFVCIRANMYINNNIIYNPMYIHILLKYTCVCMCVCVYKHMDRPTDKQIPISICDKNCSFSLTRFHVM